MDQKSPGRSGGAQCSSSTEARVKENHEKLRAHLQQESERQAERLKWLTESEGRPTFLAFVDKKSLGLVGLVPDVTESIETRFQGACGNSISRPPISNITST